MMQLSRPFLSLLVLFPLLALPAAAQHVGVSWQQDIESAKALAKQTSRLVLVHFWTPSCGPCLALDQNVFNQPGVGAALESQFVPVKLNANENSATATGFGITRVPTDVVITPDGEVVGKLISPPTPSAYISEVSQIANQYATRSGQSFAQAAAAAPVPAAPQYVNSAYANLPVAPNTLAAAPPNTTGPTQFPVAATPTVSSGPTAWPEAAPAANSIPRSPAISVPPVAGAPPAVGPAATYAAQQQLATGRYASYTGAGQITPSAIDANATPVAAAPSFAAPPLTPASPAVAGNRYATPPTIATPAAPVAPAPVAPITPIPSQFANPYAGAPPQLPAAQYGPAPTTPIPAAPSPPTTVPIVAAAAAPGVPDVSKLPPGSPPLGFDGYCPVSMRNQWKWVPGNPQFGIVHRGRTYWFASQQEQQQFWDNPDHFSPALSGIDPVLAMDHKQQVSGRREHSLDYDHLFYLFSSEATLQQFAANPERYATGVRQAMGIERGRVVR
jgi:YHS domain-containing protein/thiol-disulfide isomerase/thioredoxin